MPVTIAAMPRLVNRPIVCVLAFALATCASLFAFKWIVEARALNTALKIAGTTAWQASDPGLTAARLTAHIHNRYQATRTQTQMGFMMHARPYLTHRLVPAPFRIEQGAIDVLQLKGECL